MARRSSYAQRVAQRQRELQRAQTAREKAQRTAAKEAERARKEYERAQNQEEKVRQRLYLEARLAETDGRNELLAATDDALEGLLAAALMTDAFFDLDQLKVEPDLPQFQPGSLEIAEAEPRLEDFMPPAQSGFGKLVPGAGKKHALAVEEATRRHAEELANREKREQERITRYTTAERDHAAMVDKLRAEAKAMNDQVDDLQGRFDATDPEAVVEYFSFVLDQSSYPEGFPQTYKLAFVPESSQLVVEYELPAISIVPTTRAYKYVKSRDAIEGSPRPATQVKRLYSLVIAQVALRSLHELLEADRHAKIESIVFNGYVDTIDPATGKAIKPHLVTVRVSREGFSELDLANVEPLACLKGLNASVSKSPTELVPVRPILEFDMVDPRFIQESDVLGTLDQRPNLMELSPTEFESLISNLFEKMGLETRQTQASRDGGVDCVAFDPRPIFGGKVVIQAKRYSHTVGHSNRPLRRGREANAIVWSNPLRDTLVAESRADVDREGGNACPCRSLRQRPPPRPRWSRPRFFPAIWTWPRDRAPSCLGDDRVRWRLSGLGFRGAVPLG